MRASDNHPTYFIDGGMKSRFMGCLLDHSCTQSQSAPVTKEDEYFENRKVRPWKQ